MNRFLFEPFSKNVLKAPPKEKKSSVYVRVMYRGSRVYAGERDGRARKLGFLSVLQSKPRTLACAAIAEYLWPDAVCRMRTRVQTSLKKKTPPYTRHRYTRITHPRQRPIRGRSTVPASDSAVAAAVIIDTIDVWRPAGGRVHVWAFGFTDSGFPSAVSRTGRSAVCAVLRSNARDSSTDDRHSCTDLFLIHTKNLERSTVDEHVR